MPTPPDGLPLGPQTPERPSRRRTFIDDFKRFFFRGLAIILPTVATLALFVWLYGKIQTFVGEPINAGLREVVVRFADWPGDTDAELDRFFRDQRSEDAGRIRSLWRDESRDLTAPDGIPLPVEGVRRAWIRNTENTYDHGREHRLAYKRWQVKQRWDTIAIGRWHVLDLIGLVIAVIVIYMIGLLLGSYIGRTLYARGEQLIDRVPLIRRIYPAFKQVAEFVVPDPDSKDKQKQQFNRVVAVQYPRKGLWSVGMVTGETMQRIQDEANETCLTVFIPSSPTPFTGYVITVPVSDAVELPITIEDALKFAVSGGVLVPPGQQILIQPGPKQVPKDADEPKT